MRRIGIAGVARPVAPLVLGGPFGERPDEESFRLLDRFVELGGNAVETAHAYAAGAAEEQIGRWLARRRRDDVVLITKICHPRDGEAASIERLGEELHLSRRRLGVASLDLVLLHRDPEATPAGRVVAALERHRADGSLAAYGIANVHGARLASYDAASRKLGTRPLAVVSNYYGLARQAAAPWPGTRGLDAGGERWLRRHRRPLLAWSASAQGWFAHREPPEPFAAVYDTPENRERRRRSDELAARQGATGLQVALAWALCAPFDVLASVGPQSPAELEEACGATALRLGPQDRRWLRDGGGALTPRR